MIVVNTLSVCFFLIHLFVFIYWKLIAVIKQKSHFSWISCFELLIIMLPIIRYYWLFLLFKNYLYFLAQY